jgi:hypothetical protein
MWDQISAFLFDQSYIGPIEYENWMVLVGLPAVVFFIWIMEGRR